MTDLQKVNDFLGKFIYDLVILIHTSMPHCPFLLWF